MAKYHQRGAPSLRPKGGQQLLQPPPPKKVRVSAPRVLLSLVAVLGLLFFFLIPRLNHSPANLGVRKRKDGVEKSSADVMNDEPTNGSENEGKAGEADSERNELQKALEATEEKADGSRANGDKTDGEKARG